MSNHIKRFKVKHDWNDSMEVVVEVDLNVLTVETATMINEFWSESEYRLSQADGEVKLAVIRLFAQRAMYLMLESGGAEFNEKTKNLVTNEVGAAGQHWSEKARAEEGWGGEAEGSLYGWCGMRIVAADVAGPAFDDLLVEEIKK